MTRVVLTLEIDDEQVVLRDERGGELAEVPVKRGGASAVSVADHLIRHMQGKMISLRREMSRGR